MYDKNLSMLLSTCHVFLLLCKLLCRFVFSFALGAGPVPALLLSEMFPGRIRAKAMAVSMAVHWVNPAVFFCRMFC